MPDSDDLPIFRPRMGGGRRPNERSGSGSLRNAVLASLRGGRGRGRPSGAGFRASRRVIIKAHVARMGIGRSKAAGLHLRYIVREGVERDGGKGLLYGPTGRVRVEDCDERRAGERHQFRLVVSPEDAAQLDLTVYVRRLMARVERDTGRRLDWAAVNHYDTEHPHAHVVIRGVDRDGQELRLDRTYISRGIRWRAEELATEELGPRHEWEVRRERAREVTQERFTSLDREIERRVVDDRVEIRARGALGRANESELAARLEHLEGLRLAERISPTLWTLAAGWHEYLRELGARGDVLKQIHQAIRGDPARYHALRPGHALETEAPGSPIAVSGRIAAKGVADELKERFYAVVETPSGHAYHLPIDARCANDLRVGDVVSFRTKSGPAEHRECVEGAHVGAPRYRVVVRKEPLSVDAQISYQGPVWLDRLRTDALAPFGFGAELRGAVERRRQALEELGVKPGQPRRLSALREVERCQRAREIAARTGQVFVPKVCDCLHGRVELQATPGGAQYATVSDGSRFVVLHATAFLRRAAGRMVEVAPGPKPRLTVVLREHDRGVGPRRR